MDKNGISSDKLIGTASYMVHKIMHKEGMMLQLNRT